MKGVDYAGGRPSGQAIKDAGYDFVCRYLSTSSWKRIDATELADLHDAGLLVVLVWETTATRALQGTDAGTNDAIIAKNQAEKLGAPDTTPIYFAVDFDTAGNNIIDYFTAINQVLGVERTGVYGGLKAVSKCFDEGVVKYGWQTLAWSHGQWDDRAQIRQLRIDQDYINSVTVDINESTTDNFGGF